MARKRLSLDDMDPMEIDTETAQLFWHGREVITSMSLPRWAQICGIAAAVSSVVIAVATIAPQLIALYKYLFH